TLPADEETKTQLKNELEAARATYDANPEDIKAVISYGRRTADRANYQEAIRIFSKGIQQHPESRRLYLYRGKQHINVRHFDAAIEDLKHVTELIFGKKDTAETNKDTSGKRKLNGSLSTNTWYQLGLAYYMKGAFKQAKNAFEESLRWAPDDDRKAAVSYWLYMTLRRDGMDDIAGEVLEPISEKMEIDDSEPYQQLLLVFKGVFKPDMIQQSINNNTAKDINTTLGYGLGNWHYINGRADRAEEFFRKVYETDRWNTYGYIAAETDLARLFEN